MREEFLADLRHHEDAAKRAMQSDLAGLKTIASELGFTLSDEDLRAVVKARTGSTEVSGFALQGLSLGLPSLGTYGGVGGVQAGKGPSNSTHGRERRKWPDPVCDCDAD